MLLLAIVNGTSLPNCYSNNIELKSNEMVTVNSPGYSNNPGYSYGFPTYSSCQFTVVAPIYNTIQFTCKYYIGVDRQIAFVNEI